MSAALLAIATAVPPYIYSQEKISQLFIDLLSLDKEKANFVERIYQNSSIRKRHAIVDDFNQLKEEWSFWGADYPNQIPGMSARNDHYKKEAPLLAQRAAEQALEQWGGDRSEITHIVSVSCTGMIAPGIEFYLMQNLKLSSSVNRLGINFMGCFGAFKGLSVAKAFALENPKNRILVICTELCSLHLQTHQDSDTLTANSLFADGAAAAIVGCEPNANENPIWEIIRTHSVGFENSIDKMSWEASDSGYLMRLSHTVPVLIGRQIQKFTQDLLNQDVRIEQCDWPVHPGGKSILQAVEKALDLKPDQTFSSWETLANYGNMSSSTFLFVLNHLASQQSRREWAVGLGFGPGLSVEGILLKSLGHVIN